MCTPDKQKTDPAKIPKTPRVPGEPQVDPVPERPAPQPNPGPPITDPEPPKTDW